MYIDIILLDNIKFTEDPTLIERNDTYCTPRLWAIGYDCGIDNRVKTVIHRSMKEASILIV